MTHKGSWIVAGWQGIIQCGSKEIYSDPRKRPGTESSGCLSTGAPRNNKGDSLQGLFDHIDFVEDMW